ncbi:hypothetical protein J6590_010113 [Homalodisca vitripennis]|nr:hypothetical protein J6590_010113 [Homalodisca vitripennis]
MRDMSNYSPNESKRALQWEWAMNSGGAVGGYWARRSDHNTRQINFFPSLLETQLLSWIQYNLDWALDFFQSKERSRMRIAGRLITAAQRREDLSSPLTKTTTTT